MCKQIFGLTLKIWTSPKYFGTHKRTRHKGAFTNYVYKTRGVGGQKNRVFLNFYTIENVNKGG